MRPSRKIWISLVPSLLLIAIVLFFFFSISPPGDEQNATDSNAVAPEDSSPTPEIVVESDAGASPKTDEVEAAEEAALEPIDGPTLHGTVADDFGRGIASAQVFVLRSGSFRSFFSRRGGRNETFRKRFLGDTTDESPDPLVAEATADAEGRYAISLRSIPSGSYSVLAQEDQYASQSKEWTRPDEEASSRLDFELGFAELIRGVVVDPEDEPIAGALVSATAETGDGRRGRSRGPLADRRKTDADGRFALSVSTGTFRIKAEAKGYMKAAVDGVSSGTEDVFVVVKPSGRLAVTVTNPDGEPVPEAEVKLYSGSGRRGPPSRVVKLVRTPQAAGKTDEEGVFVFEDLREPNFLVMVSRSGFAPESKRSQLSSEEQTTTIDVRLKSAVKLSGTVTNPDGDPVAGALVVVTDSPSIEAQQRWSRQSRRREKEEKQDKDTAKEDTEKPLEPLSIWWASAGIETDSDGRFVLDTIAPGTYSLSVQSNDYVPYRDDGLELSESEAQDQTELEIELSAGLQLEGRVVSSVGNVPVERARVSLRLNDGDRRSFTTDADGLFSATGLYSEEIGEVQIVAAGYSVSIVENFSLNEEFTASKEEFEIDPAAVLNGLVLDSRGDAVNNALVRIAPYVDPSKNEGRRNWRSRRQRMVKSVEARSAATGRFSVDEITVGGELQVTIRHPEFKEYRSDPFTIEPGKRLVDETFQLESGGRLVVWVRNPDEFPVPGARVQMRRERTEEEVAEQQQREGRRGRRDISRPTGPEGKAVFGGLDAGTYRVSTSVSNFQPYVSVTFIQDEQQSQIEIDLLPENVITGIVSDTNGTPIAGVRIVARSADPDQSRQASRTESKPDGTFRVGNLGPGPYSVRVRRQEFAEKRLESIEVNTDIAVVLERLGSISGWVAGAETGDPVTQFELRLLKEGSNREQERERGGRRRGREERWDRKSVDDPDGLFVMESVPPGPYILEVTTEGRVGRQIRVQIPEGRRLENVEVILEEGLSVGGLVTKFGTAEPIADATIFLLPVSDSEESADESSGDNEISRAIERSLSREERESEEGRLAASLLRSIFRESQALDKTDEIGEFRIKDVEPGLYQLVVSHDEFVPARQPIEISADFLPADVEITLSPGAELDGIVTHQDGSSAAGVLVMLRDSQGLPKTVQTDNTGRYRLAGLVPGTYSFLIRSGRGSRPPRVQIAIEDGKNQFDYTVEESPANQREP